MKRNLVILSAAKILLTIFLLYQLRHTDDALIIEKFKSNDYGELLAPLDNLIEHRTYAKSSDINHPYVVRLLGYMFPTAKCPISRNDLMQELLDKGISTRRGIMTAHREKAYSSKSYSLPQSEFYSDNSILLPIYVTMDEEDISYIIESVKQFI